MAKPSRIVSLNLCTDQLLLLLADRSRIASLSFLARDRGLSYMADAAAGIPANYGSAEEVLALHPDLIVAGRYAAGPAIALLRRLGFAVLDLPLADTMAEVRTQVRLLAAAIDESGRGERLLAGWDARLAAIHVGAGKTMPGAAIYQASGIVIGRNSLANELLQTAGLRNLATELGLPDSGYLPLEVLLSHPPDLLVLDDYRPDLPSLGEQLLRHPALQAMAARRRTVAMPSRLWVCAGPGLAEAAERLAAAARQWP